MEIEKEKAFLEAYDKYSDAIFRYCYAQTSDRELAKDLAQETFTKTWEYFTRSQGVEKIRPFLYKVATNLIIDYRRKKHPQISLEAVMEEGFDFEAKEGRKEIEGTFDGEQVIKALRCLDEKYREVLSLRYIEDLSVREISTLIEESESNVSVRIHRGMEKLKKIIK